MAAVRAGVGREAAHEAIKEHAVGRRSRCAKGQADNDLFAGAPDGRLGLTRDRSTRSSPTRSSSPAPATPTRAVWPIGAAPASPAGGVRPRLHPECV